MTVLGEFALSLLTPTFVFFLITLVGILIGRIRIGPVSLGLAGVLGVAVLFGWWLGCFPVGDGEYILNSLKEGCSLRSSLGTALFISVIGIHAGSVFVGGDPGRKIKAFLGGAITVCAGAVCMTILHLVFRGLPKDLILGLFAGCMTSTPTLALVNEYAENSALSTIGYGTAYGLGLFCTVILMQLLSARTEEEKSEPNKKHSSETITVGSCLCIVFAVALLGTVVGKLLPVGTSGGILLCGLVAGVLEKGKRVCPVTMDTLRELGLVLFFVGAGIPAGIQMAGGVDLQALSVSVSVPLISIAFGVCFSGWILHFSKTDALSVVCGGMTSSPAFGLLRKKDRNTDPTLYSISYTGALTSLVIWTRLLIAFI